MCAPYLPASASEFPNDNPELHHGARWVCQRPLSPARALLRLSPDVGFASSADANSADTSSAAPSPAGAAPRISEWRAVAAPVRRLHPESTYTDTYVEATAQPAASAALPGQPQRAAQGRELAGEPFALEPDARAPARLAFTPPTEPAPTAPLSMPPGPLQLDLSRIVWPHRVADVPPPPAFIFRPLPSSRRAAAAHAIALATPPLAPLGYQVIDQRAASCRVQRRWRVDIAPCLAIAADALGPVAEVLEAAASAQLDVAPQPQLDTSTPADPIAETPIVEPPVPSLPDPSLTAPSLSEPAPASERRRKPAGDGAPEVSSKKKQRRRALRVASSASLMTAALPGNAELSRTLSALEADFAERRLEQPASSRRKRGRRASAATSGSGAASGGARKRAANAV